MALLLYNDVVNNAYIDGMENIQYIHRCGFIYVFICFLILDMN